eukprot:jgi/Mesvir1/2100/Mv16632-RA.1
MVDGVPKPRPSVAPTSPPGLNPGAHLARHWPQESMASSCSQEPKYAVPTCRMDTPEGPMDSQANEQANEWEAGGQGLPTETFARWDKSLPRLAQVKEDKLLWKGENAWRVREDDSGAREGSEGCAASQPLVLLDNSPDGTSLGDQHTPGSTLTEGDAEPARWKDHAPPHPAAPIHAAPLQATNLITSLADPPVDHAQGRADPTPLLRALADIAPVIIAATQPDPVVTSLAFHSTSDGHSGRCSHGNGRGGYNSPSWGSTDRNGAEDFPNPPQAGDYANPTRDANYSAPRGNPNPSRAGANLGVSAGVSSGVALPSGIPSGIPSWHYAGSSIDPSSHLMDDVPPHSPSAPRPELHPHEPEFAGMGRPLGSVRTPLPGLGLGHAVASPEAQGMPRSGLVMDSEHLLQVSGVGHTTGPSRTLRSGHPLGVGDHMLHSGSTVEKLASGYTGRHRSGHDTPAGYAATTIGGYPTAALGGYTATSIAGNAAAAIEESSPRSLDEEPRVGRSGTRLGRHAAPLAADDSGCLHSPSAGFTALAGGQWPPSRVWRPGPASTPAAVASMEAAVLPPRLLSDHPAMPAFTVANKAAPAFPEGPSGSLDGVATSLEEPALVVIQEPAVLRNDQGPFTTIEGAATVEDADIIDGAAADVSGLSLDNRGSGGLRAALPSSTDDVRGRAWATDDVRSAAWAHDNAQGGGSKCLPRAADIITPPDGIRDILLSGDDIITDEEATALHEAAAEGEAAAAAARMEREYARAVAAAIDDVEDLVARYRPRGVSVTDLSAAAWCEQQTKFGLVLGKPRKTRAMAAGTARHEQLDRQLNVPVVVETLTREDEWAVKLLNMMGRMRQLRTRGMTRELYVFGTLRGEVIVGYIDELRMMPPTTTAAATTAINAYVNAAATAAISSTTAATAAGSTVIATAAAAATATYAANHNGSGGAVAVASNEHARCSDGGPECEAQGEVLARVPGGRDQEATGAHARAGAAAQVASTQVDSCSCGVEETFGVDYHAAVNHLAACAPPSPLSSCPPLPPLPPLVPSPSSAPLAMVTGAAEAAAPPPRPCSGAGTYTVRLVDHKTRKWRSLPSGAQKDTARLQLMCYHQLYTAMVHHQPSGQADTSPSHNANVNAGNISVNHNHAIHASNDKGRHVDGLGYPNGKGKEQREPEGHKSEDAVGRGLIDPTGPRDSRHGDDNAMTVLDSSCCDPPATVRGSRDGGYATPAAGGNEGRNDPATVLASGAGTGNMRADAGPGPRGLGDPAARDVNSNHGHTGTRNNTDNSAAIGAHTTRNGGEVTSGGSGSAVGGTNTPGNGGGPAILDNSRNNTSTNPSGGTDTTTTRKSGDAAILDPEAFLRAFSLRAGQPLSAPVVEHALALALDMQLDDTLPGTACDHAGAGCGGCGISSTFLLQWEEGSLSLESIYAALLEEARCLPPADDHLLIRYEFQEDASLLGEDLFPYDRAWLNQRVDWHLNFWRGRRHPTVVTLQECWKCHHCDFNEVCRVAEINANTYVRRMPGAGLQP